MKKTAIFMLAFCLLTMAAIPALATHGPGGPGGSQDDRPEVAVIYNHSFTVQPKIAIQVNSGTIVDAVDNERDTATVTDGFGTVAPAVNTVTTVDRVYNVKVWSNAPWKAKLQRQGGDGVTFEWKKGNGSFNTLSDSAQWLTPGVEGATADTGKSFDPITIHPVIHWSTAPASYSYSITFTAYQD